MLHYKLTQLALDSSVLVRCTLAQYVADLAEIALKFLELSHWRIETNATTPTELLVTSLNCCNTSGFEIELQALQVKLCCIMYILYFESHKLN